jgi:hypothetical protein
LHGDNSVSTATDDYAHIVGKRLPQFTQAASDAQAAHAAQPRPRISRPRSGKAGGQQRLAAQSLERRTTP